MKPSQLKSLILEEFVPPFLMIILFCAFSSILVTLPVTIYVFINWPKWIFLWIGYYLWIYYDYRTLKTEGRKLHWLKNLKIYDYLRSYYPLRLEKLADIPPNRNYLFACFPHALIPQGAIWNFCTNVNNVSEIFPELEFRVLALDFYFKCPISREFLMALGFSTTEENNIKYLLNSKPAKAIVLFPGGMKEAFNSYAGDSIAVVKSNRKGFVKLALQTGTPLVPVFTFGENNILDQVKYKSKLMNYLNEKLYNLTRIRLVIPKGRGFSKGSDGILPHRYPLNTVVGSPIIVPKVENPSDTIISEYHEKFYQNLKELFENNKHIYDKTGSATKLVMI